MSEIKVTAHLSDGIQATAELGKIVEVPVGPDIYTGEYNIPLTDEDIVLEAKGKLMEEDVTIEGAHGKRYTLEGLVSGEEPSGDIVTNATTLGSRLFFGSKITSIVAPNLTTIPSATFQGSKSLTSADMPSLKTIGINGVFADCDNLAYVNLPNLENLKSATFQNTFVLKDIWLPKVTVIEGVPFYGRSGRSTSQGSVLKLGSKLTSVSTNFLSGFARTTGDVYVVWSEGEVAGAPWQAPTGTTIHYNTVFDGDGNIISSD